MVGHHAWHMLTVDDKTQTSIDAEEVRQLTQQLLQAGHSVHDIARQLEHRVSYRTIYRWAQGQCTMKQPSNLVALRNLVQTIQGGQP